MKNMPPNQVYDAIVVGLGGVGSFALRSLAKKKSRVLGIERFQSGHELGSSHGSSRLFRHAYFEHSNYVPLCLESTKMFQDLCDWKREKETTSQHVPLLERCGVLVVSDRRTGENGDFEFIERCRNSAETYDIPVELLNSDQMRKILGNEFKVKDNMAGVLEPGAGFVRPELAMKYAIEDAIENGAEVIENCQVISVKKCDFDGNGITVQSSTGETYKSRSVLMTLGAWTSKLIPEWARQLKVTRQVQIWFEPKEVKNYHPSTSPCWYLDRTSETLGLYGVPADPLSQKNPNWAKIALHGRNVPFDPDDPRPEVSKKEIDEVCDAVKTWIPEAEQQIVASKACLYTMSPDEDFILDRAPGFENVWCVAGLSGHGFKMTPALGKAVADLMLDEQTDLPIEFLRADRLN